MRTLAFAQSAAPGTAGAPGMRVPRLSPREQLVKDVRLDQKLNQKVPLDLVFRDETGQIGRLSRFFDHKPVMMVLIQFRCMMLCDQELNVLTESLKRMKFRPGEQFNLLVVSIDPRAQEVLVAPEKKEHYLREYEQAHPAKRGIAARGWHWLTGDQAAITRLTQAVGYHYVYDAATDQYAHPDGVIILTPEGKIARYFFRLEYPPRDLGFGLMEAGRGRIGSPLDALALLCYHYNPATGKYGLALMKVLRAAGIATVLLLAGGILLMKRREVRRPV